VLTVGMAVVVTVSLSASAPATAADVERLLERAVAVTRELPHSGRLTVASFSTGGPQVTQVEVTRTVDGGLRLVRAGGWELGHAGEHAFLKRPGTLLRLGGTERVPFDVALLRAKYDVRLHGQRTLDTGIATELRCYERDTGVLREVLYVDDATELIVRRETYARDGAPVRVVAFTGVEVVETAVQVPHPDGLDVEDHALTPAETSASRERGFVVAEELPGGYRLRGHQEVTGARVPTLHLVYSDGLYTLSLFEQQGRLSMEAVRRAERLTTTNGGAVWRWPGFEPRRVVWTGEGLTFTALTDAPTDELLHVVAGLPADGPPSTMDRVARGLQRVGRWLWPLDRSGDRSEE
jgi:hypothetical protein